MIQLVINKLPNQYIDRDGSLVSITSSGGTCSNVFVYMKDISPENSQNGSIMVIDSTDVWNKIDNLLSGLSSVEIWRQLLL